MPPTQTDESLADAVVQHVEHGTYPESEEVISADLPAAAYPKLLASIETARNQVKTEVRTLSKGAAPDVDTWIAQAKQLQADIERSKAAAKEIIQHAETGTKLRAAANDAESKAKLLRSELAFNESLASTLDQVRHISQKLDEVQTQVAQGNLANSIDRLEVAVEAAKELSRHEDTRFTSLLHDRSARLGAEVREHAVQLWDKAVVVDKARGTITIHKQSHDGPANNIDIIASTLTRLGTKDAAVEQLYKDIDNVLLKNWLSPSTSVRLASGGDTVTTNASSKQLTVVDKLTETWQLLDFLHSRLPQAACFQLSERLVPSISSRLIDEWLTPATPISIDGIEGFQTLLDHTLQLSDHIRSLELYGANLVADWVEEAPRIWLSRRKEAALASTRASSFASLGTRRTVERTETQVVSQAKDATGAQPVEQPNGQDDDWDDNWGDNDDKPATADEGEPEEDTSAWDLGEEAGADERVSADRDVATTGDDDDTGDAWGWDDGEHASLPDSPVATKHPSPKKPRTNGASDTTQSEGRVMTLRESYTVTGIPDSLMELIMSLISDAERLSDARFAESAVAPAARGLYSIPPLVLGMYRATAATYYAKDIAGNMLLYNDCSRLVEQLTKLASDSATSGIGRLRLDSDISLLTHFGKLAYGREMESQRTILRDLLDGAQAFTNCTVQPFAMQCENAVAITVDRVWDIKKQWEGILSPSALLQSLGNLTSTICAKVIIDIGEMSDISEEESKALSTYIAKITTLSELFVQKAPDASGQSVDMTGVYTPNWFKFQYLGEILESRLADIKYLWQEGELSLEFEVDEVVDLIEALFADSDYRRKAIRDIKASATR